MSMNSFLAQFYATNQSEEEKTASAPGELSEEDKVDMFTKLAADNGIDLSTLPDEQLEQLFNETFAKTAEKKEEEEEPEESEEKEKKAAAEREFQEKKAAQQQFDNADFMGRIMAHAYVNEMRKIAADVESKTAAANTPASPAEKTAQPTDLRSRLLKVAEDEKEEKKEEKKDEKKEDKKEGGKPPWMKDKEASALDDLAMEYAVRVVKDYNKTAERQFDVKVAAERIAAVHTLGMSESTKIASAQNTEEATHIRAIEYLEAAGYPVTWPGQ